MATGQRLIPSAGQHLRLLYGFSGFLLVNSCLLVAQGAPGPALDVPAIESAIATYLDRNGVPGAVVTITNGPDVVLLRGWGETSEGEPMTPGTLVPVASLSKSFTALALMQLVEEGRVDLDQPVARYLDEFRLADPRSAAITVRQLLEHRSGMSDVMFREKSVQPVPRSLEEAVLALRTATLASGPGERRSYHNPNYWVAARLVEVVSGMPFGVYMRDRIFGPLGMTRTSVVDDLGDVPGVAAGHVRILGNAIACTEPAWFLGGCCGVVTTGEDLAHWLAWHAQAARGGDVPAPVSSESLRLMHEGFGWNATTTESGGRVFGHNGMLFTYSARQDLLPDLGRGVGLAVVTTTGVSLAPLDADALAAMLRDALEGGAIVQPAPVAWIVDVVLVTLTAGVIVAAALAVRRSGRKGRGRKVPAPAWRTAMAAMLLLVPITLAAFYPQTLRFVTRRDLNWEQSLVVSPMLFAFILALAGAGISSLALRARAKA